MPQRQRRPNGSDKQQQDKSQGAGRQRRRLCAFEFHARRSLFGSKFKARKVPLSHDLTGFVAIKRGAKSAMVLGWAAVKTALQTGFRRVLNTDADSARIERSAAAFGNRPAPVHGQPSRPFLKAPKSPPVCGLEQRKPDMPPELAAFHSFFRSKFKVQKTALSHGLTGFVAIKRGAKNHRAPRGLRFFRKLRRSASDGQTARTDSSGQVARSRTAAALVRRISRPALIFQEQIQALKNGPVARFDGLGCYQTRSGISDGFQRAARGRAVCWQTELARAFVFAAAGGAWARAGPGQASRAAIGRQWAGGPWRAGERGRCAR